MSDSICMKWKIGKTKLILFRDINKSKEWLLPNSDAITIVSGGGHTENTNDSDHFQILKSR